MDLFSFLNSPPPLPTIEEFPTEIGARLKRQRLAFGWSQEEMAQKAQVSVQTIKAQEAGRWITLESLMKILMALGHGREFLELLEDPFFPSLAAQKTYVELEEEEELKGPRALRKKRVKRARRSSSSPS